MQIAAFILSEAKLYYIYIIYVCIYLHDLHALFGSDGNGGTGWDCLTNEGISR